MKTMMRQIRDPDTGRILEKYSFSDPFGAMLQGALDCRLLNTRGTHDENGRPIYLRTSLGRHGPN
jgi:hypothetical protein